MHKKKIAKIVKKPLISNKIPMEVVEQAKLDRSKSVFKPGGAENIDPNLQKEFPDLQPLPGEDGVEQEVIRMLHIYGLYGRQGYIKLQELEHGRIYNCTNFRRFDDTICCTIDTGKTIYVPGRLATRVLKQYPDLSIFKKYNWICSYHGKNGNGEHCIWFRPVKGTKLIQPQVSTSTQTPPLPELPPQPKIVTQPPPLPTIPCPEPSSTLPSLSYNDVQTYFSSFNPNEPYIGLNEHYIVGNPNIMIPNGSLDDLNASDPFACDDPFTGEPIPYAGEQKN